jgi:hypothetical protein
LLPLGFHPARIRRAPDHKSCPSFLRSGVGEAYRLARPPRPIRKKKSPAARPTARPGFAAPARLRLARARGTHKEHIRAGTGPKRSRRSHAVSTTAGTPVSGSRADSAPGLPHTRILSVKPQPTSLVSAIAEEPIRTDQPWAPQENGPQGSALQVDGSKPTDAVAASSRAAATPIQQSDAPWAPQENGPQESALQGDGTKPTDAVAASSPAAATPIQQSDAPWAPHSGTSPAETAMIAPSYHQRAIF